MESQEQKCVCAPRASAVGLLELEVRAVDDREKASSEPER